MELLYRGHIRTLETVLYIEVVLIQWNLSIEDTLGPVLYIEVVLIQWNFSIEDTLGPWKLSFI